MRGFESHRPPHFRLFTMLQKIKRLLNILRPIKYVNRGNGNSLIYEKPFYGRKSTVKIYGNNNKIVFKEKCYLHNCHITIGFPDCPANNCYIEIGEHTSFNGGTIQLGEDNSKVIIGSDCMFSFGIELNCTDSHSVLDENENLLNRGRFIEIGSNVWVCKNAVILKNTKVPDNSIVSQNSIVTKQFEEKGTVIAGNPARQVKSGIHWKSDRPNNLLKD